MALRAIRRNGSPDNDLERDAFQSILAGFESRVNADPEVYSSDGAASSAITHEPYPGLVNLRNTCYLNSILQYFFSVNTVRDLVVYPPPLDLASSEQGYQDLLKANGISDL